MLCLHNIVVLFCQPKSVAVSKKYESTPGLISPTHAAHDPHLRFNILSQDLNFLPHRKHVTTPGLYCFFVLDRYLSLINLLVPVFLQSSEQYLWLLDVCL